MQRTATSRASRMTQLDADNSTYVIVSQNNDSNTVLDGFVIAAGARSGLNCVNSSLVVVDCVFQHNSTAFDGGAVHQETSGVATVHPLHLHGKLRQTTRRSHLHPSRRHPDRLCSSSPMRPGWQVPPSTTLAGNTVMTGCTFTRNAATADGAVEHIGGWLTARNCTFTDNSGNVGGAIRLLSGHTELADCLFENNLASIKGGALFYDGGSSAKHQQLHLQRQLR